MSRAEKIVAVCCVVAFLIMVGSANVIGTKTIKRCPSYETVEPNLPDAVDAVIDNVVHIRNNTGQWQGSGVFIAPDLILTARHVVDGGENFSIKTNDEKVYQAERAISSKKYDLGFIKLQEKLKCTTEVGDIADCRLGQDVFAIGSPFGDINFNSVTAGVVSSLNRKLEDFGCPENRGWGVSFQTDAAGHPGNSGCPVYTLDGKVRGILVGSFSNALIYCIPAKLVANDCQAIQLMFLLDEYQKETHSPNMFETYAIFDGSGLKKE